MSEPTKTMKGWGDLNIALNALVREGVISAFKTDRGDKGGEASIEVTVARGADQAEVVARVRQTLTGIFADATVRTKTA